MISETVTWYPEFESLGFIGKVQLGYTSTLAHLFATPNTVFPLFAIVLCILVYHKYKSLRYRAIATVPIVLYLVSLSVVTSQMSIFDSWTISFENVMNWVDSIRYVRSGVVLITQDNYTNLLSYVPVISFTLCALCVLFSLYYAVDKSDLEQATFRPYTLILLILVGFATRVVVGFSPTVWASSLRTFIILYFAFIVCIIYLNKELLELRLRYEYVIWAIMIIFATASFTATLLYIQMFNITLSL